MKNLKIHLTKGTQTSEIDVTSEAAMWNTLRKVRDELTDKQLSAGVQAQVTDENGKLFKNITFTKNTKGKIEMKTTKRTRRGFSTIILQKFDSKSSLVNAKKYQQFRVKLESLLNQFDKMIEDEKKAAKKVDKRRFKSLAKFSKQELEEYLKSMK